MEAIMKGMMGQKAESFDINVVSDVTEGLFANVGFPGSDLIARNIHRGRDHGLPGYNEYREDKYMYLVQNRNTLLHQQQSRFVSDDKPKYILQGSMWYGKGLLLELPTSRDPRTFVG